MSFPTLSPRRSPIPVTFGSPLVLSDQVNAAVQFCGQTAKADLRVICENHVLGKLKRGTDIIDE